MVKKRLLKKGPLISYKDPFEIAETEYHKAMEMECSQKGQWSGNITTEFRKKTHTKMGCDIVQILNKYFLSMNLKK